ncbi:MAG TPA: amidohydrolase family protein [Bryobacteraceae bacterium]|nr:amidohydrolase family protein [Bryobacteraceae bacterium]
MIVLRNGTIYDGTGAPGRPGNVLLDGEKIADVGAFEPPADAQAIDCRGLAISPGFIDAHSHSDLQVLENRREKVLQGVTSEVVGNCGFSAFPAAADRRGLYEYSNGILFGDDRWGWATAAEYLEETRRRARLANVVSLVGHGTLRIAHVGHHLGKLSEEHVSAMEQTLDQALAEGAAGFSTGLMYSPGESAPFDELERLCRVVARRGKVYATHMRDYMGKLVEAVEEQLELARRTGCRLQISHMQAVGEANWPLQQQALELIERAHEDGIDVAFDCYPYVAGSTVMTQILPQWALGGGLEAMLARLADPSERARIERETVVSQGWRNLLVSAVGSAANANLVGMSLEEIGTQRNREPVEVVMDLLLEERGDVTILEYNQSEENLRQTVTHPLANIISDGFYVKGRPHPRLHGAFACLLGDICRQRGWMTLPEAVRKTTDLPARRMGIPLRGRLERGWFADVAVFDPEVAGSAASYDNPQVDPVGIRHVFRNGQALIGGATAS